MKPTKKITATTPWKYAEAVRSGKIVTGEYIKLAVARFYKWIETAEKDGFYIDHEAGLRAISFFPKLLNHTKGTMAGQPFDLAPFQQFTIYNLFAWKNTATGLRRIKKVYDKRGKKNGKSAEMAGLGLFMMAGDDEAEAEVYIGATKEEQAKICWKQAKQFIDSPRANPLLKQVGFSTRLKEIRYNPSGGTMLPLGGDSKTQDGINSHLSIIDEYHAHKDDTVKENLESSSIQRQQPITYHITTAGFNIQSACYNYEEVCKSILKGIKEENNSLWIMIHELDEADNWQDPATWIKANPLLGNGLSMDRLQEEYKDAIQQPSKQNNFKTKHLNMWVDAPETWILDEVWQKGSAPVKIENFLKYGCWAALDLSSTTDLTAFVFVSYPDEKGVVDILPFVFCPADTIDKRSKEDRVPYRYWAALSFKKFIELPKNMRQEYKHLYKEATILTATPGNVIDYDIAESYIRGYNYKLKPTGINYDRYNSTQIVTNLTEAGVTMLQFAQVITYLSAPTKELERLALGNKIRHGGNPILRWCLTGCRLRKDPNENIRLDKAHSTKRIDPLMAAVMAIAGVINPAEKESQESVYNNPETEFYV